MSRRHVLPTSFAPGEGRIDRSFAAESNRTASTPEVIDLGRVFRAMRRNWQRIAIGVGIGVVLSVAYVRLAVPRYQATSTIRIDARQSTLPSIYAEQTAQDEVFTEIEVLRSRTIAAEVVDSLALRAEMTQPTRIARGEVFRSLQIAATADTGTLRLVRNREGGYLVEGTLRTVTPGKSATVAGVTFTLAPRAKPVGLIELHIRSHDEATTALRREVDVGRAGLQASIIALRMESADPGLARDVLNAWTGSFIRRRQAIQRTEATSTAGFIQAQLDTLMPQLQSAEDRLLAYRDANSIVAPEFEASTQVTQRAELLATRNDLDAERSALQQAMTRVRATAARSPIDAPSPYRELLGFPSLLKNQAASELLRSLSALDDQRTTLLIRRTSADPDVVTVSERIRVVESQLQGLTSTYLRGLTAQVAAVDGSLAQYATSLRAMPAQAVELARLERAPRVYDELVSLLQTRLKEAQITEAVRDASVRVVDAAVTPVKRSSPNAPLVLAFGLVGGLALGAGLTLVREQRDDTVRTRGELQDVSGVPVLGLIPSFKGTSRPLIGASETSPAPSAHPLPMPVAVASTRSTRAVDVAAVEAFARLLMNIQWAAGTPVRSLLITSPLPGEGKTTSTIHLAASAARQQLRVLVVDADLRRGGLTLALALQQRLGVVDFLEDRIALGACVESVTLSDGVSFDAVGTGRLAHAPAGPRYARGLEDLLAQATMYDLVLIDSPPINIVADAALVGPLTDGVVLITRSGETSSAAVDLALEQLRRSGANVLGTILNGAEFHRSEGYGSITQYRAYITAGV